jgi:hypothetical protein
VIQAVAGIRPAPRFDAASMLRRLDETGVDMLGWKTFLAGAVVAMATVGGSALAHEGARTAGSCPNLTVNAGKYGGKKTLRLVAIGVSCTKGRHLAEAFYRKAAGGGCESHGVHCDLSFPGRWNCGFFFATETKETGGAISGCFHTSREKLRLYPTKGRRPSKAPCNRNVEYRPGLFAAIAEYVGMTCAEARNFVLARANPPHRVPPGFVCHDLHVEAGGGAEECLSGSRRIKIEYA